jgi:(p)ppGpp synthase/HD superfamily hydrolase
VSVLTGDGEPEIDWMRHAKIRSTRSKLRSYFRRKQRQNLRDAGLIILMEYLNMFADVIQESSFLEESFSIPTTLEELDQFLPGNSNYQDLDDLLIDIGSSSDNNVMRTAIAKIFLVPQKTLASAESNSKQSLPRQLLDIVNAKRQSALDVSSALEEEEVNFETIDDVGKVDDTSSTLENVVVNGSGLLASSPSSTATEFQRISINGDNLIVNSGNVDIADPEHVCPSCLPIFGDEIIGTRPHGVDNDDFVTTVHRGSCGIAMKAKNESRSRYGSKQTYDKSSNGGTWKRNRWGIKSSWTSRLKKRLGGLKLKQQSLGENDESNDFQSLDLVDLVWDESYAMGQKFLYLAEISLICEDRKLLLADCSEIVSDMSEIVKTGSLSTKEHAILNFLVKVESLNHLQQLMNRLRDIRSVMSVERNVSIKSGEMMIDFFIFVFSSLKIYLVSYQLPNIEFSLARHCSIDYP